MRPERDNATRHAHIHMLCGQLLGSTFAEFLGHLSGRVCPFELVRIRRVSQRLNFGQFFATLLKLVERLKFQRRVPFRESLGSIAVAFEKRQENAVTTDSSPVKHERYRCRFSTVIIAGEMPLAPTTRLGPYEIIAPLGAGGMGEVVRARDTRLGREVALKILPESFARESDRLVRFEQEARAVAALNHPNILAVFDVGQHNGSPFSS